MGNLDNNGSKEPDYFRYYDADVRKRRSGRGPLIVLLVLIVAVLGVTGWLLWYWMDHGSLPF